MHAQRRTKGRTIEDLLGRLLAGFIGAAIIVGGVLLAWIYAAERVVIVLSKMASLFGGASQVIRKRVTKGLVEGRINIGRRSLNRLTPGTLPYPAKIRWVNPDNVESYLQEDNVIVRMSYHDNPHRNLVLAGLLYMNAGLLPESRQYLRRPFQQALDLLAVEEMLVRAGEREALLYFRREILPEELEHDDSLSDTHELLGRLSDAGYLGRILLPELVDYPVRIRHAAPRSRHLEETRRFVEYLHRLTATIYLEYFLPSCPDRPPLDFWDNHIKVSFILVGRAELLETMGYKAYLRRIEICRSSGAQTIFLLGSGRAAAAVREIARSAKSAELIESYRLREYNIPAEGRAIPYGFARLVVKETEEADEAVEEQLAPPTAPRSELGA